MYVKNSELKKQVSEIMEKHGVSRQTAYRWIQGDKVPVECGKRRKGKDGRSIQDTRGNKDRALFDTLMTEHGLEDKTETAVNKVIREYMDKYHIDLSSNREDYVQGVLLRSLEETTKFREDLSEKSIRTILRYWTLSQKNKVKHSNKMPDNMGLSFYKIPLEKVVDALNSWKQNNETIELRRIIYGNKILDNSIGLLTADNKQGRRRRLYTGNNNVAYNVPPARSDKKASAAVPVRQGKQTYCPIMMRVDRPDHGYDKYSFNMPTV